MRATPAGTLGRWRAPTSTRSSRTTASAPPPTPATGAGAPTGRSLTDASFADALRAGDAVAVVAEVKRRSPSRGWLDADLDAGERAALYARAGAAAVSVLTDGPHFGGSLDDLASARAATDAPLLRKDFVVSENDVLDAADAGAAAVLLIVAALDDGELARFVALAGRAGLDALVEAHDEDEAARALAAGARLVGVNQRDLRTFEVVDRAGGRRRGVAAPRRRLGRSSRGWRRAPTSSARPRRAPTPCWWARPWCARATRRRCSPSWPRSRGARCVSDLFSREFVVKVCGVTSPDDAAAVAAAGADAWA